MAPAADAGRRRAHVVLFPFMAQGHVAPFRCLAALVRRCRPDARVTVVATSGTAASLAAHLAADGVGGTGVHALPFRPADHGLPADAESSAAVGFQHLIGLFLASESLRPAFQRFVDGLRRSDPGADVHIVADMFLGWTVDVARGDAGVTHSLLLTTGGYGSALYFSLWNSVPLPDDEDGFQLPHFPDVRVQRSQLTNHLAAADGTDAWSTFIHKQIAAFYRADALLVNTAENLEPKGLRMLRQWLKTPTFPVGPLLLRAKPQPSSATEAKQSPILAWLDKQPAASVLYISFGSQYTINAQQMMELAAGLERSSHRFVWVIRPPSGFDVNGEFRPEWLPEGFKARMESEGRGLVARCWAPQVDILAHAATGAFLTHCGWNSAQESLAQGVPLLGWPLSAEQFYNAKTLAEEMGVCVELARGGAAVEREKVAEAVETVLGETKERAAMKRNAEEMKKVIDDARDGHGDQSSVKVMRTFFDAIARGASY